MKVSFYLRKDKVNKEGLMSVRMLITAKDCKILQVIKKRKVLDVMLKFKLKISPQKLSKLYVLFFENNNVKSTNINANSKGEKFDHFWSKMVGSGRANEGLRDGWLEQLEQA